MKDSIAILGRQPFLGLAELESLYGSSLVTPICGGTIARVAQVPQTVDFARLGGTVKLCGILTTLDSIDWKDIERYLLRTSPERAKQLPAGKMHLGLSVYGIQVSPNQLMASGLRIKNLIHSKTGQTVRLVPNKGIELNAAQILHNKLTATNGWEVVLIRDRSQTIIAQTTNVQDIDSYSQRDFGRPKRDARVGMLPPKLAQIIINLAAGSQDNLATNTKTFGDIPALDEEPQKHRPGRSRITVLDPFCGTGVVLQEALLMGYQAYGTDIEPRMVDYSRVNLEWLDGNVSRNIAGYRLANGDATSFAWQPPINIIASETYLGRPFTSPPTAEILAQTVSDCNIIVKKFLQNIYHQIPAGTRLCLALPAWHIGRDTFRRLPLIDHLPEMGYNLVRLQYVLGNDLLYFRENQIVARHLLIITRN